MAKKYAIKVFLTVFGFFALGFISVIMYYYFSLSGNPLTKWYQGLAVVTLYESRYGEPFSVVRTDYSYKTKVYDFEIVSNSHPEIRFRTSLSESQQEDAYAAAVAKAWIMERVDRALGKNEALVNFKRYISEVPVPDGQMEADLDKRLRANTYVVSLSWEVETINPEALDGVMLSFGEKIEQALETPLGELKFILFVQDGTETYYREMTLQGGKS